jgi:hypothetical protein
MNTDNISAGGAKVASLGKFDACVLMSYIKACKAHAEWSKNETPTPEDEQMKSNALEYMQKVERLYQI